MDGWRFSADDDFVRVVDRKNPTKPRATTFVPEAGGAAPGSAQAVHADRPQA